MEKETTCCCAHIVRFRNGCLIAFAGIMRILLLFRSDLMRTCTIAIGHWDFKCSIRFSTKLNLFDQIWEHYQAKLGPTLLSSIRLSSFFFFFSKQQFQCCSTLLSVSKLGNQHWFNTAITVTSRVQIHYLIAHGIRFQIPNQCTLCCCLFRLFLPLFRLFIWRRKKKQ